MHYGIRLLMGLTLTWMIVVWPPIHQDLSFFGPPLEGVFALSEAEMQTEKGENKRLPDSPKNEGALKSAEGGRKKLEHDETCDPKKDPSPWWMTPHLPF